MNITIYPRRLKGEADIPSSKSDAHRKVIAAALAEGESVVDNIYISKDIEATMKAMAALGAGKMICEGSTARICGIEKPPAEAVIDCGESGSTLRFLIPVAAALGVRTTFIGRGKLPERPITPYLEELPKHGVSFDYNGTMPFTVSGKLEAGEYRIGGDISSQFITGLLLALSVVEGESRIVLTSHLESRPYVDLTAACLAGFGCTVTETGDGFAVSGRKALAPCNCAVEGDWSQAAFFEVANSLGSEIKINGLNVNSAQGDKKILEICREIVYNNSSTLSSFELDCSDIPDLVPILAVLASFCRGESRLTNVARLRIKESDRLEAISKCLNAVGGDVRAYDDLLVIKGVGELRGGEIDSFNDHRIAMAMAIAATRCTEPLNVKGAECVAKSYPTFWDVYASLGGCIKE